MTAMTGVSMAADIGHEMASSRAVASAAAVDSTTIVFVVEADLSVRGALESLILGSGRQVETFATAEEFLSRSPAPGPSCLVLDVTLPDLEGIALRRRVAVDCMPIILTRGYGDVLMMVQAMEAGSVSFATRRLGDDGLLGAIGHALECSEMALRQEAETRVLRDRYATLSRREREVMALAVTGLMNKQIAYELDISVITVKAHRGKVMRKMEARSLARLVNMAATLDPAGNRPVPAPRHVRAGAFASNPRYA